MHWFDLPASPPILHWLSGGQLASRLLRSQRLHYWLSHLYGPEPQCWAHLPQPFRYRDVASRLFAPTHGRSSAPVAELIRDCRGTACLCQQSAAQLMGGPPPEWIEQVVALTGLAADAIATVLEQSPFAVVHRALRDDLRLLSRQGWLQAAGRGCFARVAPKDWPTPPTTEAGTTPASLSPQQQLILLRALEPVAFVQPELEVILDRLWQQTLPATTQRFQAVPPARRVFLHLDYILSDEMQEQVDSHQQQIEDLWRTPDGGVIQFENWMAQAQRAVTVTVYPVCLHYARRAKYLSAYGLNADGQVGWHNYRLDRIRSPQLRILPWGDPQVPAPLREMRHQGQLPTPAQVQAHLEEAWGFNFYLPKALLILRFPRPFAEGYVQDTERHPTFGPIAYAELPTLVRSHLQNPQEQQSILHILEQRSAADAYYWGWVRVGDINVTMRLRDWRPKGEVIAPLVLRQQMIEEAQAELAGYQ